MEVAHLLERHARSRPRPSRRSCARGARRRAGTGCRGAPSALLGQRVGLLALLLDAGQRLAAAARRARRPGTPGCAAARRPARSPPAGARAATCMRDVTRPGAAPNAQLGLQLRRAGPGPARASASPCPCRAAPRRSRGTSPWPNRLFSSPKRSVSTALHRLAARALGQQRHLHAADLEALRARIDVGRRRLEGLDLRRRGLRLELLHRLRHVDALPAPAHAPACRSAGRWPACGSSAAGAASRRAARRPASTSRTRSRVRKNRRQSPCATDSDSASPTVSGLVKA